MTKKVVRKIAWFKVDDGFWSHPKVLTLPAEAGWLWLRAGTYAMQHLTDGYIAQAILRMLGTEDDAQVLVDAGLWLVDGDGYRFHDWEKYQPSRDEVEAERERNAERQRRFRDKRRESQPTNGVSNGGSNALRNGSSNGVSNPASNGAPTRPDPTRPEDSKESSKGAKETTLPSDWVPTKAHYELARERNVNIAAEVESFRDHAYTHDRRAARWNGAFTTWLKKAKPMPQSSNAWMARTETPPWMQA